MTTTAPPDWAIHAAEDSAACSPCAKSKRGVALYYYAPPVTRSVFGVGFNGPPLNTPCPGRERCGDNCGRLCVHAEMRAIRGVQPHHGQHLCIVHVKLGAGGRVTAGGPPSCWQCSREILDVGFVAGVWLYERTWVTCRDENGCLYCAREACAECEIAAATGNARDACDPKHDAHHGLQTAAPRWVHYTPEHFHRATLRNAGLR